MSGVTTDVYPAARQALQAVWLAVAELVLTTNDDQPEPGSLASAEDVSQLAVEMQGRVAEALGALPAGPAPDPARTAHALAVADQSLREAGLLYWRDLRAHGPVSRLRGSVTRRGGAWPSWWRGVEQSLDRCEGPLVAAGRTFAATRLHLVPPSDSSRRSS